MPRRHASPLGAGGSLFGDGAYSENIYVGGVLVQPVAEYLLPGASYTSGTYNSRASNGRYVYVDRSLSVPAGTIVADLGTYDTVVRSVYLHIMRRNSAGSYTSIRRLFVTTAAGGWQYFPLASSYTIPDDGLEYRIGIQSFTSGDPCISASTVNQAYGNPSAVMEEGATGTGWTETTNQSVLCAYRAAGAVFPDCIVITGAATVAPDAVTGAAGFSCRNIVLNGASASLTPTVNCKGLLGFVTGKAVLLNGAKMHMDRMGKAGNFGNLTAYTLAPESIRRKLKKALHDLYTVQGEGAAGAAAVYQPTANFSALYGTTPAAAGAMQTGGGGPGAVACHSVPMTGAKAGKGGPCCGGAAGAILVAANQSAQVPVTDSGDYGGPAGPVTYAGGVSNTAAGGTPGDPVGAPYQGSAALGGGGGLLMLFTGEGVSIGAGCIVSADGSPGGNASGFTYNIGASGAGGGLVCVVTRPGLYSNAGTVRAAGGAAGSGGFGGNNVGGGLGSVNIFQNAV